MKNDELWTRADIHAWLWTMGAKVSEKTIERWISRGLLKPVLRKGVPRCPQHFRPEDVRIAARGTMQTSVWRNRNQIT